MSVQPWDDVSFSRLLGELWNVEVSYVCGLYLVAIWQCYVDRVMCIPLIYHRSVRYEKVPGRAGIKYCPLSYVFYVKIDRRQ